MLNTVQNIDAAIWDGDMARMNDMVSLYNWSRPYALILISYNNAISGHWFSIIIPRTILFFLKIFRRKKTNWTKNSAEKYF